VVIRYDTRFLSEAFGAQVARVLAALGVKSFLCPADTPTPALAHEVLRRQAAGGVMVTAAQPARIQRDRVLAAHGGPAPPEASRRSGAGQCVAAGPRVAEVASGEAEALGLIERIDPREAYLEHLRSVVRLDTIRARASRS